MNKKIKNLAYLIALYFFSKVVFEIDLNVLQEIITSSKSNFYIAFLFFTLSQLSIGIIWCKFIQKYYNINFKISFELWIKSIAAKYIPGKISSPILRIENEGFKNNKFEFYNHILIENLILILISIIFGSYIFLNSVFNFVWYLLIVNFLFFLIFVMSNLKLKKFKFTYFKNIFYLEISSLLNIFGIYFLTLSFNKHNNLELVLVYIFVSGISMLIFIVPAGIGIRENFFIQLGNSKNYDEVFLASLGVALRASIIIVDLIFVVSAFLIYPKINHSK